MRYHSENFNKTIKSIKWNGFIWQNIIKEKFILWSKIEFHRKIKNFTIYNTNNLIFKFDYLFSVYYYYLFLNNDIKNYS